MSITFSQNIFFTIFFQSETPVNVVVHLDVPFQTIIDRVKDRMVHPASGRIYNTLFNPPKVCTSHFEELPFF